ncbi:MAG: pilus assembly protein TadG-related protein [Alphaproteobacteria bacterium]
MMQRKSSGSCGILCWLAARARGFSKDTRGNFSILMGIISPILIGALGVGFEVSNWYMTQRAMQNAADASVIAAATNGGTSFATEARAVAATYGYTDGGSNISVSAANGVTCPSSGNDCYSVTITGYVPLYLAQVVGFSGDAVIDGAKQVRIAATAIATSPYEETDYCILALGASGAQGITSHGAPNANLTDCNVMSNTTATCTGHNLNAAIGAAHSTNNGCGINQYSNVPIVEDPYSALASNIPANTCASYPQMPSHPHDPQLPESNRWSGSKSLSGNTAVCGDLQLTGDVTINSTGDGAVLVIYNGRLNTNGYTLRTSNGSALTLVFGGTSGSYKHYPTDSTNGGILDFNAPASGPWSGVAIYQDPALTSGVSFTYAGNNPAWDITGLAYLPKASVTFSGAVNKASNGYSCFALVVDNVTINGTANILARGECPEAGLDLPSNILPTRTQLVG